MPSNPERVYKGKGWISYYEFFNTNKYDKMSAGEKRIYNYLKRKNIEFECQKKFDDCKNINHLLFDFYLPNHNTIIEFDGQQHFKMARFSKDKEENQKAFVQTQKNDRIKNNYCHKNNINLLRLDDYHLTQNIVEWELDNELSRIAAEIAIGKI
jgi:very-short-patch-repair endonuclease